MTTTFKTIPQWMKKISFGIMIALFSGLLGFLIVCEEDAPKVLISSRTYQGHESIADSNHFVNAYPATLDSRLDDCQTCHTGGDFTRGTTAVHLNACDYCHQIIHPDSTLTGTLPTSYNDTLNSFGQSYLDAGRTQAAFTQIGSMDSDGDTFFNTDEINDLKYPGSAASKPGQTTAPLVTYSKTEITALTAHSEFMLANSNKQQFDDYATYKGVKLLTLLQDAGVDVNSVEFEGISVIAPDGYVKDFTADVIKVAYPKGLYYAGLDTTTKDECGFVTYPDTLPAGLVDGGEIADEQWLLLAYEKDALALDPSYLDITSGKINGDGPFRVVVPQSTPGAPDRGSQYSPTTCGDGYDYDNTKDHNAGSMVRGVVAIRVNPLPAGYEDFDYQNGGWAYIDNESVVLYGFGINP